jgi:hypothetical protein
VDILSNLKKTIWQVLTQFFICSLALTIENLVETRLLIELLQTLPRQFPLEKVYEHIQPGLHLIASGTIITLIKVCTRKVTIMTIKALISFFEMLLILDKFEPDCGRVVN